MDKFATMPVIIVRRQGDVAIYHDANDVISALGTINLWLNEDLKKPPGERSIITVRQSVVSVRFWNELSEKV